MTFGQFLSILRARWKVAVGVLAVTVIATLVVSLLLPKQYRAVASVVVDFKPDPVSAVIYGGTASPGFMATQVDIIQSDRVAQRVVKNLKLDQNPQVRRQWQDETGGAGTIESWLGSVFQRSMEVVPSRESTVISIGYRSPDPRFAAALANAFAQAYIDTTLELRVDPARQYTSFFLTQSKDAREALEKAQARLSAFQQEKGITATDERLDIENARLNELSSQLTTLQSLSAESASREAQAQGAQGANLSEVLTNPVVSNLKFEISRSDAQLKGLQERYGDAHPAVIEAKANLAELRSRLDAEIKRATGSVGLSNNVNRQRQADVRAALDAQRTKVLQMKAVRDEGLVLQQVVENAQKAYDAVQARYTQTNLESQTTQSNVNLLTQASPPIEAASPKVLLNTLLALFVGTLLALMAALMLELRDRRVRNADDITAAIELPVIGIMAKPGSRRALRGQNDSMMQQRLLAPLPQLNKGA
jgi:chain length determinant protein EpsF